VTLALSKYAGSHAWLVEQRPDLFPLPAPGCAARVPFAGAGSPIFGIYAPYRPLAVSDKNERLINAWMQVRDDVEGVIERLHYLARERCGFDTLERDAFDAEGRQHFERVRAELDTGGPSDRAACMLFVLRSAYNGLWRVNLDGACNSPYGKPDATTDLVRALDLRRMSELLQGVEIRCEGFEATLAPAVAGDATYLDPPFQGTHTAFCSDHGEWEAKQATLPGLGEQSARERLADMLHGLDRRGVRWTLSDADTPTTRHLYAGWQMEIVWRQNSVTCKGERRGDAAPEGLWRNWSTP